MLSHLSSETIIYQSSPNLINSSSTPRAYLSAMLSFLLLPKVDISCKSLSFHARIRKISSGHSDFPRPGTYQAKCAGMLAGVLLPPMKFTWSLHYQKSPAIVQTIAAFCFHMLLFCCFYSLFDIGCFVLYVRRLLFVSNRQFSGNNAATSKCLEISII